MTKIEFEHTLSGIRGKLLAVAGRFPRVSDTAEDAEDIVQEALTELWMLFESGYDIRSVEALAVKITKAVCVKHFRQRKVLTNSIEGKDFPGGTEAGGRLDMAEALNTRKMLFSRLNDTQRQYLTMRNERMMSLDEIAAATGRPKASVKATISQARRLMNELIKKI